MRGYTLHLEAFNDIDDIRAYIADDNPDAADRVVREIFDTIRLLVDFPHQGYRRPESYFKGGALRVGPGIRDSLRSRYKTVAGFGGVPWTAQPSRHGRDFAWSRVGHNKSQMKRKELR